MVFVGVRAQGGQDRGVHIANLSREQSRVTEVHQRLVAVVAQELLDVIGQAHAIVQRLGVLHLVVVQLVEQVVRVVLQIQALGIAQLGDALLVLVADVVAVDGLIADNQTNHVGGVRQLGVRGEVHRQIEAGVEEEGLEQGGGHLALVRVVALVVVEHDLRLLLQKLVVLAPVECGIDLFGGAQGGEDGRVAFGVHGFHEGDVGVHGLLVRGERVRNQGDGADRALDGVKQGQAGEDAHGERVLVLGHLLPAGDVVGDGDFFGQPEVAGQAVPDLKVFLVFEAVPVDCGDAVDEFQRFARNGDRCHE